MSDMPEQDVEALMSYLQPQNLSEDFEFCGSSMEEDFLPAMLDQEDSQPGQSKLTGLQIRLTVADSL